MNTWLGFLSQAWKGIRAFVEISVSWFPEKCVFSTPNTRKKRVPFVSLHFWWIENGCWVNTKRQRICDRIGQHVSSSFCKLVPCKVYWMDVLLKSGFVMMFEQNHHPFPTTWAGKELAVGSSELPLSSQPAKLSCVSAVMNACVAQKLRTIHKTAPITGPQASPETTTAVLPLP